MARKGDRGFSLIESLIVIAIVMIMVAFSAPQIRLAMNRYQLETKGRRVASLFLIAKRAAAKSNMRTPIVYKYDPAGSYFWVDADRGGDLDPGEQITLFRKGDVISPLATPPLGQNPARPQDQDYAGIPLPIGVIFTLPAIMHFHPNGTLIEPRPRCFMNCPWQVATSIRAITIKQVSGSWTGTCAVTITPSGIARLWFKEEYAGTIIRNWSPL